MGHVHVHVHVCETDATEYRRTLAFFFFASCPGFQETGGSGIGFACACGPVPLPAVRAGYASRLRESESEPGLETRKGRD